MDKGSYRHLSAEERAAIMLLSYEGVLVREIGQRLGRSPSTISRELRRNALDGSSYNATVAGEA